MGYIQEIEAEKTVIFTAIGAEAKAIRRALEASIGRLAHPWEVHVIGIRAGRLPAESSLCGVQRIILAGFAGALDPTLQVGDVVVDGWPGEPIGFRCGKIHTAGEIIATPASKASLFAETGALAVDMEGDIVRAFAERLGARFLHVRAISDSAAEAVDPTILRFVDDVGNVRPTAVTLGLLRRPSLVPQLARLGANAKLAGRNLGEAMVAIVEGKRGPL